MSLFEWSPFTTNSNVPRDSSFASMLGGRDPWDLSFPLFQWSYADIFSLGKAFETILISGENGAAKSTGSAAWFVLKFLSLGMGGLVCCVKPGDAELFAKYAEMTGRADSLIVVSPKNNWRCNLLRYAQKRPGIEGSRVESLVTLLMTIVEAAERGSLSGGDQKFFERALRQILRNGVEVCVAATGEVTMTMLHEVITSAPRTHADVHSPEWQAGSACYRLIEEADGKPRDARAQSDFELAAKFFLRELPDMPADISAVLKDSELHPEIKQGALQDLLSAIVKGTDLEKMPMNLQQAALIILPKDVAKQLQASSRAKTAGRNVMDYLNNRISPKPADAQKPADTTPPAAQAPAAARSDDDDPPLPAVRGTWAQLPGGFYVRYLPDDCWHTRIQLMVPDAALQAIDPAHPLTFDATQYLAVLGQEPGQRLGITLRH